MDKKYIILISVIVLIVIAGGAFYGGMIYGKNSANSSATALRANFAGRTARTGTGANAGFTMGNIISKDSNSITLQLPNNTGSKIIFYSSATQISKTISGTSDDLKAGTTINITGSTNPDGSITAQSIQIRPAGQQ